MPVTPRQREIYDFICRYVDSKGRAPTIGEIGEHFEMSSPASVHYLLSGLEKEGLIRRIPNARRGIELIKQETDESANEIPLLGVVAAGRPIEAILSNETITVPPDMVGKGRTFALRVRGDSMIEDRICDGDFIVVESRPTAENGQTVVALVDGSEATVKRFYREKNRIRLQPANSDYEPMIIDPERVSVQGIVKGVIRKYQG